ncbi:TRAP transporter small permease [Aestuariivita boseongensis]|jgi:TRAP-type C4-dicarboxylate transport system permease small subunit|uniref:TRAP transporter small permease n=1 Tax=Aestuariivita boseongensis TaxID=1470562 RepID=UPI000680F189|nr:TRAP transporter small permease subunit [Aestuariivita boseongensis]
MHAFMMGLARLMAILGGIVLSVLILLTCVSVIGRSLNGMFHSDFMTGLAPGFSKWMIDIGVGPVNGDFELVEAGVAFAIFAFIPLCQITAGHASVDIFANAFPKWMDKTLRAVTEVVFAAVLILIAVQLFDGMMSKKQYGETSFLIEFPIWWAYAASLVGAVVSSVVAVYMAVIRVVEMATGRTLVEEGAGAEH